MKTPFLGQTALAARIWGWGERQRSPDFKILCMSGRAEKHLILFQEGGWQTWIAAFVGGWVTSSKGPHGLKSFEFRRGGVRSPKKIDQEEKWDVDQARITAGSNTEIPE